MPEPKNIVEEASRFVFDLFKEKLSQDYVYHNYQHTLETVETCRKLSKAYPELNEDDKEILLVSAWFHDTGYIQGAAAHEDKSKEIAREFLTERDYPSNKIARVLECIESTKRSKKPENLISQILADADIVNIGEETFFAKSDLLRNEWVKFGIRNCNDIEWAQTQLHFLESSHFHTQEAVKIYGEQVQLNIQEQTKRLQKLEKKKEKKEKEKSGTKAQPKRGIETMFRSIYMSHINLSSIADSKANMMISINSLIISITLTLVGAKLSLLGTSFKENQIVIYPIIALLLTSLGAIIFAILSAKPKITRKINHLEEIKKKNVSILFFGNYANIGLQDFEYQMRELMKSEDELYGNMIRDLYFLGKVLAKKYQLIRISYIVFMVGLIFTVVVTVYVVIYLKRVDDI
ncbi:MAG: HD domain-containing protein [Cytophagaceae bacterium]|nr:HD domain-containing protein [Cytophagaceae bacterium]